MSPSEDDHHLPAPNTLERILTAARREQSQYSQRAAVLSHWLWRNVSRHNEIARPAPIRPWLARVFATRRVRQRQLTYRSAGGKQSSTAIHALQRIARLSQPGDRDKQ